MPKTQETIPTLEEAVQSLNVDEPMVISAKGAIIHENEVVSEVEIQTDEQVEVGEQKQDATVPPEGEQDADAVKENQFYTTEEMSKLFKSTSVKTFDNVNLERIPEELRPAFVVAKDIAVRAAEKDRHLDRSFRDKAFLEKTIADTVQKVFDARINQSKEEAAKKLEMDRLEQENPEEFSQLKTEERLFKKLEERDRKLEERLLGTVNQREAEERSRAYEDRMNEEAKKLHLPMDDRSLGEMNRFAFDVLMDQKKTGTTQSSAEEIVRMYNDLYYSKEVLLDIIKSRPELQEAITNETVSQSVEENKKNPPKVTGAQPPPVQPKKEKEPKDLDDAYKGFAREWLAGRFHRNK
jgi:hypothetical protein